MEANEAGERWGRHQGTAREGIAKGHLQAPCRGPDLASGGLRRGRGEDDERSISLRMPSGEGGAVRRNNGIYFLAPFRHEKKQPS